MTEHYERTQTKQTNGQTKQTNRTAFYNAKKDTQEHGRTI